jgi:acyl-CoA thioesterase-2
VRFSEMMDLENHGPDTFVGGGPRYPWGGLYGGQIVAQALRAAALTVSAGYEVHSLHAYFIRMGDDDEPIRFEVERLRNGQSFISRSVVARQSTGAILNMAASFQRRREPTMDVQLVDLPSAPGPEELEPLRWSDVYEMRPIPSDASSTTEPALVRSGAGGRGWIKVDDDLGEDPLIHAAALAFVSDSVPGWVVSSAHLETCRPPERWRPISLDHAMWFHRPVDTRSWLLLDFDVDAIHESRGLAYGRVFNQAGVHVATVSQEVLLRRPKSEG